MTERHVKRIFYSTAGGDLLASYRTWKCDRQIENEVARTYTGEFFSMCDDLDAEAFVVSPGSDEARLDDDRFQLRHIHHDSAARGIHFHLQMVQQTLRLMVWIVRFRADVAIVSDRSAIWWMLAPLRLLGIHVIIALHVRMWPAGGFHSRLTRNVLFPLDRWFLRNVSSGLLAVSQVIVGDLKQIGDRGHELPTQVFRPLYNCRDFEDFEPPVWSRRPFNVLFIGRVEETKGVFDLVKVADHLRRIGEEDIRFEVIGSGGALPALAEAVDDMKLGDCMTLRGNLTRDPLLDRLRKSHAVIVPTHSDMGEGYNKVCAEAVLTYRPVVTSRACPILADIRPAAVEVPMDQWRPYADSIVRLANDQPFFEAHVAGARAVRKPFFDDRLGWGAACLRLLGSLGFAIPATNG